MTYADIPHNMWYELMATDKATVTKQARKHPHQALRAVSLQRKAPGRYADGNGLYLVVDPSGARRWILRTMVQGRRTDIGLGGVAYVSLAEARERARALRAIAREGGDPVAENRRNRAAQMTFEQAARKVHSERAGSWRNAKHADQWIATLETYAFPKIGTLRVDQVDTPDVLQVLSPIWLTKPETARRVRQRLGAVLDWAKAAGHRAGDNPTAGVLQGLPKQPENPGHHAALPWAEVPGFVKQLRNNQDVAEIVRLAFEFLILTCVRTSEVLGAAWGEISGDTWTIPAERMKMDREHRVPLSPRCLQILDRARELTGGEGYVFPGRKAGKPLSNMVFLMALRRMRVKVTAHGFRSSFRDWAAERTGFAGEVCEMALAHVVRDKTEAAYRRGDLFEKRRQLMVSWAAFATSTRGDVVALRVGGVRRQRV